MDAGTYTVTDADDGNSATNSFVVNPGHHQLIWYADAEEVMEIWLQEY
ncbi:MAG: hypothetical protein IPJ26_03205 [Bacteroidetes bacterium]|nr:hypothetical protein [Bacteroidota bacterium]